MGPYGNPLGNSYVYIILLPFYVMLMAAGQYVNNPKPIYSSTTYLTHFSHTILSLQPKNKKLKTILTLLFQYILLLELSTLAKLSLI